MKLSSGLLKNTAVFGLLPVSVILFRLSSMFPDTVENIYSRGVFPVIVYTQNLFTGSLPFSAGEVIISLFILFLLYRIFFVSWNFICKNLSRKGFVQKAVRGIFFYSGLVYFLFIFTWGFNYNRKIMPEIMNMNASTVTPKLIAECLAITADRAAALASLVSRNEKGIFHLTENERPLILWQAKPCFFSKAMSKAGIGGFYCPFTGEANYNKDLPDLSLPFTISHESAHRLGFARENDANFIAYIVCSKSPSAAVRYSAEVAAVSYLLSALRRADESLFKEKLSRLNEAVKRDMKERDLFWHSQRGWINDVSEKWNDAFLKANMQKDGTKSYGRFVELLVYLYQKR